MVAAGVPDPAKNPTEPVAALRVTPLSTAQALFFLANGVEIPPEHVACGLVRLSADGADPAGATRRVFRVHCCAGHERKPTDFAYYAVWYREHWFYIDDRDRESQSTLVLMLHFRRLDFERQQVGGVPALMPPVER